MLHNSWGSAETSGSLLFLQSYQQRWCGLHTANIYSQKQLYNSLLNRVLLHTRQTHKHLRLYLPSLKVLSCYRSLALQIIPCSFAHSDFLAFESAQYISLIEFCVWLNILSKQGQKGGRLWRGSRDSHLAVIFKSEISKICNICSYFLELFLFLLGMLFIITEFWSHKIKRNCVFVA